MSVCIGFPNLGYTSYQPKTPFQSSLVALCRMRAVAGVGHVETIQTWGRPPVITLQHTLLHSTIQFSPLLSYISRCYRCMPAEDLPILNSTLCISQILPCSPKTVQIAKQLQSLSLYMRSNQQSSTAHLCNSIIKCYSCTVQREK